MLKLLIDVFINAFNYKRYLFFIFCAWLTDTFGQWVVLRPLEKSRLEWVALRPLEKSRLDAPWPTARSDPKSFRELASHLARSRLDRLS